MFRFSLVLALNHQENEKFIDAAKCNEFTRAYERLRGALNIPKKIILPFCWFFRFGSWKKSRGNDSWIIFVNTKDSHLLQHFIFTRETLIKLFLNRSIKINWHDSMPKTPRTALFIYYKVWWSDGVITTCMECAETWNSNHQHHTYYIIALQHAALERKSITKYLWCDVRYRILGKGLRMHLFLDSWSWMEPTLVRSLGIIHASYWWIW